MVEFMLEPLINRRINIVFAKAISAVIGAIVFFSFCTRTYAVTDVQNGSDNQVVVMIDAGHGGGDGGATRGVVSIL